MAGSKSAGSDQQVAGSFQLTLKAGSHPQVAFSRQP